LKKEALLEERPDEEKHSEEDQKEDEDEEEGPLNEEEKSLIVEEILNISEFSYKDDQGKDEKFKVLHNPWEEKQKPLTRKEQKRRDFEEALKLRDYNYQLQQEKYRTLQQVNELHMGLLEAKKLKLKKMSKKEKQIAEYYRKKEELRGKIKVHKDDECFRIIVPKSMKLGQLSLAADSSREYANHYVQYKLNIKDLIKIIKKEQGLHENEYVSKQQVAAYLKKNLHKILVPEDPKQEETVRKSQKQKLTKAEERKIAREREKEIRKERKAADLERKRRAAEQTKSVANERKREIEERH